MKDTLQNGLKTWTINYALNERINEANVKDKFT